MRHFYTLLIILSAGYTVLAAPIPVEPGEIKMVRPKYYEPKPSGVAKVGQHPHVVLTEPDESNKVKVATISHKHPDGTPTKPANDYANKASLPVANLCLAPRSSKRMVTPWKLYMAYYPFGVFEARRKRAKSDMWSGGMENPHSIQIQSCPPKVDFENSTRPTTQGSGNFKIDENKGASHISVGPPKVVDASNLKDPNSEHDEPKKLEAEKLALLKSHINENLPAEQKLTRRPKSNGLEALQHPDPVETIMDYSDIRLELQSQRPEGSRPSSTRTATLTNLASKVVDPLVGNGPIIGSALQGAVQLLGTLSEIGKELPVIAPAFVLLKIIVDLEKKAQDVDAKCSDLVERITFMLSHLPALQNTEILPATQQVIDRVNDVLKDAAALIAAYRKQSFLARRLSFSNSDRFAACAQNINTCCSDLLISLQIHQTIQIGILTRPVPVDEEDQAAKTFVEAHGGSTDAVLRDRGLLREFARQQDLAVDESDIVGLQLNVVDSIQQIHARLEYILQINIQLALTGGFKNLALELSALEAEQKFVCVQCEKEYTNLTNGPLACSFHRAVFNSEAKHFPCCSTNHPCQFGTHRSQHHCDYPYSAFFVRASKARTHGNVVEWASVEDVNLENSTSQQADVGQLLRWVWRGSSIEENTLLITVGTIHYTSPYYFATFTAKDLQELSRSIQTTKSTLIFRTSADDDEYASAQWVLSDSDEIAGICLTAKAATSPGPWIRICPINISICTKSGDVSTLSKGGLPIYRPASPYILPEMVKFGPTLSDAQTRPPRTDFKSKATPGLQLILKSMSDPPLMANTTITDVDCDYFSGKVAVFNNNAPTSMNSITIASVSALYRMVGDPEYTPVRSCRFLQGPDVLPTTIEPRQSFLLGFEVAVPRTEEDTKLAKRWSYRAFVARHRPIRIKLVVEDMEGNQCSLVMEYVVHPPPLEKQKDGDIAFLFIDDPQTYSRFYCHVRKPVIGSNDALLEIRTHRGLHYVTESMLNQIVYRSLKSGETEVELGFDSEDDRWAWTIWALVDASCCRVYAFKVMLLEGKAFPVKRRGVLHYFLCPDYGDVSEEVRPILPAAEKVTLPAMEQYPMVEHPQDDDVDDLTPSTRPSDVSSSTAASHEGVSILIPQELTDRLASIDNNLGRLADSFERLLDLLPALARRT